jgi:hypothetical protein
LGNTILYDASATATGDFNQGDTLTQANTGATGTLKFYNVGSKLFRISGGSYGNWSSGYEITSTSGGTFTPSSKAQSPHSDIFQIYGTADGQLVGIIIRNNKLYDSFQGIFIKDVNNILIENNLYTGWCGTVHVCTLHSGCANGIIRNNTFLRASTCIRIYSNGAVGNHFDIYNNIVRGTLQFEDGWGQTSNIKNNIFGLTSTSGHGGSITATNNYTYRESIPVETLTSWFVDYDGGDYRLENSSVKPVDFGTTENHSVTDILGNTRDAQPDAGCYEYVPSDPNNPPPRAPSGRPHLSVLRLPVGACAPAEPAKNTVRTNVSNGFSTELKTCCALLLS